MRLRRSRSSEDPPLGWPRALAITVLLVTLFFVAPLGQSDDPMPLALAGLLSVLTVIGLAALVVRRIRRLLEDPTTVDLPTLAVLLAATIIAFSTTYFVLQRSSPGEVAGLETRLDALYMTLVTVTTVGYGDVHPAGQAARGIACLQLVFNAFFLGALLRTVSFTLGSRRSAARDSGTQS
jgi:voltage-gated potassium channel